MKSNAINLVREMILDLVPLGYSDYPSTSDIIEKHPFVSKVNYLGVGGYAFLANSKKTGRIELKSFNSSGLIDSELWDLELSNWFLPSFNQVRNVDGHDFYHKSISQNFTLAHEFTHLYTMIENPFQERINEELKYLAAEKRVHPIKIKPELIKDWKRFYNVRETFCDLFSTYFLFPHEQDFKTAEQDIVSLDTAPSFLEGLVRLSSKRGIDLFTLTQRLANSDLVKEKLSNNFILIFSYEHNLNYPNEGKAWRLFAGDTLLPRGIKYKEEIFWSFEDSLFTQNTMESFPKYMNISSQHITSPDITLDSFGLTHNLEVGRWGKLEDLANLFKKERNLKKYLNCGEASLFENIRSKKDPLITELNFCGQRGYNSNYLCLAGKIES